MRSGFKKLAASLLAATCLISPAVLASTAPAVIAAAAVPVSIPPHVQRLFPDAARQCGPVTGGAANPVIAQRIKDFTQTITRSQTGRDLMMAATNYKNGQPAWMCFTTMSGNHALYYTGQGVLRVGLNKSNDEIVGDAAHELRHLFQEKSGLFSISPANANDRVHVEYAGEADAEATASLVLWELKQAGTPAPWQRHNDHNTYGPRSICYAHITTSFKQAVENGASPTVAAQQAFRAWYRDRDLLSHYKGTALFAMARAHDSATRAAPPLPSRCDAPDQGRDIRRYELPSDSVARAIDNSIGQLPSYRINFVQQGGGLKAILQAP